MEPRERPVSKEELERIRGELRSAIARLEAELATARSRSLAEALLRERGETHGGADEPAARRAEQETR
jgi:hypothetical protein